MFRFGRYMIVILAIRDLLFCVKVRFYSRVVDILGGRIARAQVGKLINAEGAADPRYVKKLAAMAASGDGSKL